MDRTCWIQVVYRTHPKSVVCTGTCVIIVIVVVIYNDEGIIGFHIELPYHLVKTGILDIYLILHMYIQPFRWLKSILPCLCDWVGVLRYITQRAALSNRDNLIPHHAETAWWGCNTAHDINPLTCWIVLGSIDIISVSFTLRRDK